MKIDIGHLAKILTGNETPGTLGIAHSALFPGRDAPIHVEADRRLRSMRARRRLRWRRQGIVTVIVDMIVTVIDSIRILTIGGKLLRRPRPLSADTHQS